MQGIKSLFNSRDRKQGDLFLTNNKKKKSLRIEIRFSLFFLYPRAFGIDDEGAISFIDPAALNSTVVHLMVVAKDSGLPPRQVRIQFLNSYL